MSADLLIHEILKKFYSKPGNLPQADGLYPLFIADMDSPGRDTKGLGYNELGDPARQVPLVASLPEVLTVGVIATLYWTTTRPASQPPISAPAEPEAVVDEFELTQEIIDRRVLSFSVVQQDFNLPPDHLQRPDHMGFFFYSIRDPLNDTIDFSPYREVVIDLAVPGTPPADPSLPNNPNLTAAVVAPSSIDPSSTRVTMTIQSWTNQQVGDQVTVIWNGVRYVHPSRLTAGDIGRPFVIDVPLDVIEQGGDGLDLPVQYEIRDLVLNYSRPSLDAFVDVAIDPDALPEPEVPDTVDPDFEFDLDLYIGQTVRVSTSYGRPQFQRGDMIQLYMVATTSDGVEVRYESELKTVNTIANLFIDVPRVIFAFAASGTARLFYESTPAAAGSETRISRTRRIRVISAVNRLLPPDLVEANGTDTVDLADVTAGFFRVRIPVYPGQMAGDQIRVTLTGRPGNGSPLVSFVEGTVPVGGEQTPLEIPVTALLLRALLNGSLSMGYTVTNTALGLPPRTSTNDPTFFVVDRNMPELPALTCAQVQGTGTGAFLPSDSPFAEYVVPPTANLRKGEPVTFRFGLLNSETPPSVTQTAIFNGHPFSFFLNNAQILPFDELDVQATYSAPR